MNVLVVFPAAGFLVERLASRFPGVRFTGAAALADAEADLEGTDVLMGTGADLTSDLLARMPRLAWIQALTSGTDHIRPALDGRDGILLTSARGIHGPQMAETALLHMLWHSREVGRLHRDQARHVWAERWPRALERKTVGIVGLGAAGQRLAAVCNALDMTVHAVSRTGRPVAGVDRVVDPSRLLEVACEADFLVLVVPHTPQTDRLVAAEVLAAMKPTAVLVNLARGEVVDEDALVEALRAGQIAGAGLDVFATEPLPPASPLWDLDNVLITPHIAGRSDRYAEQLLTVVEPNLRHYLAGEHAKLRNVVSLDAQHTTRSADARSTRHP